jgi:hypothetical protein
VSCTDKNNPNRQATSISFIGNTSTIFLDQGAAEFPPIASFPDQTACDESCAPAIGACCRGSSCAQRSGCRCSPEVGGGVFAGGSTPCDPNPCCPTCEPYVSAYNPVLQSFGYIGKCCRSTYVHDGHGACCPPGRDCCGGSVFNSSGADNGACCPESKPYCCEASNGISIVRQCQQYIPVATGFRGGANACESPNRVAVVSLPSEPCTIQMDALPMRVLRFQTLVYSTGYTLRFQMGDVDNTYVIPLILQSPFGGQAQAIFCKPPGVTEATLTISDVQVYPSGGEYTECFPDNITGYPAWNVSVQVTFPCDCNPLP